MTDPAGWYRDPRDKIDARFRLYRAIGIDTLRIEMDWRSLEQAEGKWDAGYIRDYLVLVKQHGFRVKLIVGDLMGPPRWFLDAHPDARITDETGRYSTNTVSYWYPDLRRLVTDKARHILAVLREFGLQDRLDYVIPALGPAGEPIYPVPWTLGPDVTHQTYWCYDPHAQADFRARMRRKYGDAKRADALWGTDFKSWDKVRVLPPGVRPGPYWHDVLTWYRDAKRAYIEWEVTSLKKLLTHARVVVYVPGTAYTQEQWDEAVRTAQGADPVKHMADSFWLIDFAARAGTWLQYTGVENGPEVARLRAYIDRKGHERLEVWGENAGFYDCAKDPMHLAEVIRVNRLHGLDFTHAHFAFEADGVTPNAVWPKLAQAYDAIRGMSKGVPPR